MKPNKYNIYTEYNVLVAKSIFAESGDEAIQKAMKKIHKDLRDCKLHAAICF